MNYYTARQHATNSKWDYTCENDKRIWPVGYCADHPGTHDSAEEARQCYKRYMLDNRLLLNRTLSDQQRKCTADGCEKWTQSFAQVGAMHLFNLCDEHRNRETVESLYEVGETWSSY